MAIARSPIARAPIGRGVEDAGAVALPTLSDARGVNVSSTGFAPAVDYSYPSAGGANQTAYWIAHPTASWPGTPTGAQIRAGDLSDNSAADYSGDESAPGSGSGTITEQTALTGLTPGTSYTLAWVVYDSDEDDYSNVEVGTTKTARAPAVILTAAGLQFRAQPDAADLALLLNPDGGVTAATTRTGSQRRISLEAGQLVAYPT